MAAGPTRQVGGKRERETEMAALRRCVLRQGMLGGQIQRDRKREGVEARLPVPVVWLEVDIRGRNELLQRLQKAELAGVEDDDNMGLHQWLQQGRTAPVNHQRVA